MKKLTLTGPESTGKTTLAQQLAEATDAPWVPEYARDYLAGRPGYEEADLLSIARGQLEREQQYAQRAEELLICDTSLEVIQVWGQYRYGRVHPWIAEQLQAHPADLYLLCYPDLPWEPDPLRENPHDRDALFAMYEELLSRLGAEVAVIRGQGEQRLQTALHQLGDMCIP